MWKKVCFGILLACFLSISNASAILAQPGNIRISYEEQEIKPARYLISGENYVGLRSLADALKDMPAQFDVVYENRQIFVIPNQTYTVCTETSEPIQDTAQEAVKSTFSIICKGITYQPSAYVINGYTYYRLRDLAEILGFSVNYDANTRTACIIALPEKTPEIPENSEVPDDPSGFQDPEGEQIPDSTLPPLTEESTPQTGHAIDGTLTILLDAGHGDPEPGATAVDGVTLEAQVNMDVTVKVRDYLQEAGAVVYMIREEDDTTMTNTLRKKLITQYAQSYPLDLLFSIHHNSHNGTISGSEMLVQIAYEKGGAGQELAQCVETEYRKIGREIRPTKYQHSQSDPSKDRLFVLKTAWENNLFSVMSEFCFLDNWKDFSWVQGAEGREREARAIADGILAYYEKHPY